MSYTVTLLPGDGIGPEVMEAAVQVIKAASVSITWDRVEAGAEVAVKYGSPLPESTLQAIRTNRVALKGPFTTAVGHGLPSVNVALRKALDLYACLRPVKSIPGVVSRYDAVDLVLFRENTEDLYSGVEHLVVPGVVESLKIITARASTRIARFAFAWAERHGRRKVTAVHKANIMKMSDGLFLECCRAVARGYPAVEYTEVIVDNCCLQLVLDPHQFDVLLLENLYGDILSDLCAGLVGGLGLVAGANIGGEYAVFEPVHGSAPDIAGKNLANPVAAVLTAALLLTHLGEEAAAERITRAVSQVIAEGKILTRDLGGSATTTEMTGAIAAAVRRSA